MSTKINKRTKSHHKFQTCDQLRQAMFEYIEIDYNRFRRHSAID